MTRVVLTLPDEKEKLAFVKQMAKLMGLGFSIEKEPKTKAAVAKTPRTQLQQEFVDAYKEALAAERGEVQLSTMEEFLAEWRAEKQNGTSKAGS